MILAGWLAGIVVTLGSLVSGFPGGNAHIHTYSGANSGVYIDLPGGHWCGVELRAADGSLGVWPFCDVD